MLKNLEPFFLPSLDISPSIALTSSRIRHSRIFPPKGQDERKPATTPKAALVVRKRSQQEEENRKQEFLRLNYPQDIRRNLQGLVLPEDDDHKVTKKGTRLDEEDEEQEKKRVNNVKKKKKKN